MIIFDLKCSPLGHVFEAWFGSSDDFETQRDQALVQCPLCGSPDVGKAPMAPAVGRGRNDAPAPSGEPALASPAEIKQMLAAAAALQRKILQGSENVGDRFAAEARSIHLGEAEARSIHGLATRRQAEHLVEEGVPVAPLPFPLIPPGEEN